MSENAGVDQRSMDSRDECCSGREAGPSAPTDASQASHDAGASATQPRRFLVPGTYDPITKGHIDVIERASRLCDEVIVAVAASPAKRGGPSFTLNQRVQLAREALADIPHVRVEPYTGLTVAFAYEQGATAIVKGLRAVTDFEYELQQANLNDMLDRNISVIFVMASSDLSYVSSSAVRELASLGADVSHLVTPNVERALHELYGPQTWFSPSPGRR